MRRSNHCTIDDGRPTTDRIETWCTETRNGHEIEQQPVPNQNHDGEATQAQRTYGEPAGHIDTRGPDDECADQRVAQADPLQYAGNAYVFEVEVGIEIQHEANRDQQQTAPENMHQERPLRIASGESALKRQWHGRADTEQKCGGHHVDERAALPFRMHEPAVALIPGAGIEVEQHADDAQATQHIERVPPCIHVLVLRRRRLSQLRDRLAVDPRTLR